MSKHPLQTLVESFSDGTRSYSGRGMYGKECLGVDIQQNGLGDFIADLLDAVMDDVAEGGDTDDPVGDSIYRGRGTAEALRGRRADNMGLGTIVYFPRVPFVGDAEESEGEDQEDDG